MVKIQQVKSKSVMHSCAQFSIHNIHTELNYKYFVYYELLLCNKLVLTAMQDKKISCTTKKPPVTSLDTDSMLFCVEYFCKKGKRAKRNFIQILNRFVAEGGTSHSLQAVLLAA